MHVKHVKTLLATLCGVALTSGSAFGADAKRMSSQCVSDEAYKNFETCPGGPAKFEGKKKKGTSFKSAPPPIEKKKAQDQLGPKFDIKAFHAQVLMTGALPMSVLEKKIDDWIAAKK